MTWILGSFLVTSCHVVISKGGWKYVRVGRSSRCATGRGPRDRRTTRSDLDSQSNQSRVEPGICSRSDASLQALAPPGSRKKIWGKKKSPLWVYVSPSISQIYNKLCAPFENKMREIYFYKEVCFVRSLKFVLYLWLCSWLGLWEVYNTNRSFWLIDGTQTSTTTLA